MPGTNYGIDNLSQYRRGHIIVKGRSGSLRLHRRGLSRPGVLADSRATAGLSPLLLMASGNPDGQVLSAQPAICRRIHRRYSPYYWSSNNILGNSAITSGNCPQIRLFFSAITFGNCPAFRQMLQRLHHSTISASQRLQYYAGQ